MADEFFKPGGAVTVMDPPPSRFNPGDTGDMLFNAHLNLSDTVAVQGKELADHGGQLKIIPGLAASVQQNFGIWFATICAATALILGGFAFIGAYQVTNAQRLSEQGKDLNSLTIRVERVDGTVQSIDLGQRELRADMRTLLERSAPEPPSQRQPARE